MTLAKHIDIGKLPPQSIPIEEAVLGAAMLEAEGFKTASTLLAPDAFYKGAHSIIFKAMVDIASRKEPVDILTITQELRKTKELDLVGGAYYIVTLTNSVASSSNTEYHCRILLQMYYRRKLIAIAADVANKSYDDFFDVFDTIDEIKKELKAIEGNIGTDKIVSNDEIISEVIVDIKNASSNGGVIGLSTGMVNLDHALMGLRGGLKYVVA